MAKSFTSFVGPDHVDAYTATVIAASLKLFAKTGLLPNRAYTPRKMMERAAEITGRAYRPREYLRAAHDLERWAKLSAFRELAPAANDRS